MVLRRWGVIQHKLVLTTGLIKWIGHRREIRKLTFRAFALRRSKPLRSESNNRSDKGLTLETSAFESLYGGQFTFEPSWKHQFIYVQAWLKNWTWVYREKRQASVVRREVEPAKLRTSGLDLAIARPYMITKLTRNKTQLNKEQIQLISIATNLCTDIWYEKDPLQQMYDLQLWLHISWPPTVL